MSKYNKWMQYFWLAVAVVSGAYAVISFVNRQEEPVDIMVYIMPFLAIILFFVRRWHNQKMKTLKDENQKIEEA